MTYKTHNPARQATSAYFQQGVLEGAEDRERAAQNPPIPELGPDADLEWSYMYREGYEKGRSDV